MHGSDKVLRFRYPEHAVKIILRIVLVVVFCGSSVHAGDKGDLQTLSRIKEEAIERTEVMQTLSHLSDVIGPRLTNSPGYQQSAEWAKLKLGEWGLEGPRLEPWGEFGRGWQVIKHSLEMTSPRYMKLTAYPKAWTKGTSGIISGKPVLVELGGEEDLERWKGKLRGAIVMLGAPGEVVVGFEPNATRHTAEELEEFASFFEKTSWRRTQGGESQAAKMAVQGERVPGGGEGGGSTGIKPAKKSGCVCGLRWKPRSERGIRFA